MEASGITSTCPNDRYKVKKIIPIASVFNNQNYNNYSLD